MTQLFFEQLLNGLQLGMFLFLVSAGLTLVFGFMNIINLAHGSLFMIGAYAVGSLESERFELAAASMPAARAAEFWHIVDVGTGLMAYASVS